MLLKSIRSNWLLAICSILVLSLSGCKDCPIDQSTFILQKKAVAASAQSSRDAAANWSKYNADQQKAYLKANARAWASLNKVYNKK